jgi:hypothetical protein
MQQKSGRNKQKRTNAVKKVSAKNTTKPLRNRARYECKSELEKLIDLINLLPANSHLPELSTGGNEQSFYNESSWTSKARHALCSVLKNQPENFQRYIWSDAAPKPLYILQDVGGVDLLCEPNEDLPELWQPTLEAVERYESFSRLQEKFRRLTRIAKSLTTQKPKFDGFMPANVLGDVRLMIDQNGIVQYQVDEFSEAVSGVDIRRVRECEICACVFWAKNNNSWACSPKHSKARQMRLLRKNWKESGEYYLKARRRKNEKKIKENRSQNDGNL